MRFSIVPVAIFGALTLAGAALPPAPAQGPRPLVILVHGRGQLGFDSAATRREWKRDLDSALATVGLPRLRDEDVRLAWYADVLDPASAGECAVASTSAVDELGLGDFARGFLASLTSVMSESDESFGARGLFGDILYFVDRGTRCAAEQRVGDALASAAREKRPVIVVAYSLGSLVTYAYLSTARQDAQLPSELRLVTLGSPLGMREIRDLVLESGADTLRAPRGVKSWDNVYDPDDFFSAPLSGKGVRDRATESASNYDAHQIRRYLRDRSTGLALGHAICASLRDEIGASCSKL